MVLLGWHHSYPKEILLWHSTTYCTASATDLEILTLQTAAATCNIHAYTQLTDGLEMRIMLTLMKSSSVHFLQTQSASK